MFTPAYFKLNDEGGWVERVEQAYELFRECRVCPNACEVRRLEGERGLCRADQNIRVASFGPHFGEERVLVGQHGSGTIFMAHCNLRCVFCQNYTISHQGMGKIVSEEQLAEIMLHLQERGCHNINVVTPTHFAPQILAAVGLAATKGLHLPIVYNSGGYESVDMLRLLEDVVDIYMPDFKYGRAEVGLRLSHVPDYPTVAQEALREMHRQVGDLVTNGQGLASRGLLVRHLVLPNDLSGTSEVVRFLAEEISPHTAINVMDQYYPHYQAWKHPDINRTIDPQEYATAVSLARKAKLRLL
jgi:putative pyruvate formate lyase activating enzyme